MVSLPNPFSSAASDAAAEQAAASLSHAPAPSDAAADLSDSGATDCPPDEAAASLRPVEDAAVEFVDLDQTCFIGEIFVGARKLDQLPGPFDQAAITGSDELLYVTLKLMDEPGTRDLPDVPQELIEAMEPMPLFLRQAG